MAEVDTIIRDTIIRDTTQLDTVRKPITVAVSFFICSLFFNDNNIND